MAHWGTRRQGKTRAYAVVKNLENASIKHLRTSVDTQQWAQPVTAGCVTRTQRIN